MREVPRYIPFRLKLHVLLKGMEIIIGLVFLLITVITYLFSLQAKNVDTYLIVGWTTGIWGVLLILYALNRNYRALNTFVWGEKVKAVVTSKEPGNREMSGSVIYRILFTYEYLRREHHVLLQVPDAYWVEIDEIHFLYFSNPERYFTPLQYSESFQDYFKRFEK